MTNSHNIADRLSETAKRVPTQKAVVVPNGRDANGRAKYAQFTFDELDRESNRLAHGLQEMGIGPETRLVLMVPPSLEFIALTFAIFKTGAVCVLIDPGMGRTNIFNCLEEVEPHGFVAIPIVHVVRALNFRRFRSARLNVTVGRRWLWGGKTYAQLRQSSDQFIGPERSPDDLAAIIFTSGSTGPPKGVAYEHGMFNAQVDLLQQFYDIQPGGADLSGFPLFALFNSAMGVTTVIPDMNPTRPADADPEKILEAIRDQQVTQAYGSPAIWNRVGRYCENNSIQLPERLTRILSAGAPVPAHVLQRMQNVLPSKEAAIHTPYGATESLPVASISSHEVLTETARRSAEGAGTCVGSAFPKVQIKVIRITDGPIEKIDDAIEMPIGEIGEVIVQTPSTTREYFRRPDATSEAKITDGDNFWHRMGDTGYLDDQGRLWFCGRKAHIVETPQGRMFTIRCEAIFNEHPEVFRSALVGLGAKPQQRPVIIVEPEVGCFPESSSKQQKFIAELRDLAKANSITESIGTILFHRSLPVDIRHNVKIFREKLVPWAEQELQG